MKLLKLLAFPLVMLVHYKAISQAPTRSTTKLFFEKVFVHTDRSNYASGDDLWFKVYLVNPQDGHLINTSRNLYVELISPADTVMLREIIRMENGTGNGDFQLPDSIPAGKYRIRAYTNWMRNFGDNFIFEKQINLVSNLIGRSKLSGGGEGSALNRSLANAGGGDDGSIHLYPEGGSLVEGISSIVAVKAFNAQGKAVAAKNGAIISSAGDTVAHFGCDSMGMGLVALLPVQGQSYKAVARINGKLITRPVSMPLTSGLTLSVRRGDTSLVVIVRFTPTSGPAQQTLTVAVNHAGRFYIKKSFQLNDNIAQITIPYTALPEGVSAITLYDDQSKPNCERLVYIEHPLADKIDVKLNKSIYQSREKVTAEILTTDAKRQPVSAELSLAVTDVALAGVNDHNIKSYLLLQSDLKGAIEHPALYFDPSNPNRAKQLDMLMLTQGWRDFVWRRLADSALKISYIPEQGISLSGRVRKILANELVAGANITLSAPRALGNKLFIAQTNTQGKYYFDDLQIYGNQNVRITSKDAKGKANGWIQMDSLNANQLQVAKTAVSNPVQLNNSLSAMLIKRAAQGRQRSLSDTVINLKEVKVRTGRTLQLRDQTVVSFGYPTEVLTVTPKDYQYKTLREYILFASNQARADVASNRIVFMADGKQYAPRILVDNKEVPFTDDDPEDVKDHYYNDYYDIPIDQVIKVEIRKMMAPAKLRQPSLSSSSSNAYGSSMSKMSNVSSMEPIFIIYLTLKPGALRKKEFDMVQADIKGYYDARVFYEPVHEQPDRNLKPDNRVTIFWEPVIKTDSSGHAVVTFYNADPKTNINVDVQGITATGHPLYKTTSYKVR